MKSGFFFLSLGLLALRANFSGTSGQAATGGTASTPKSNGFPLPTEKLFLELPATFLCVTEGPDSDGSVVTWYRKGVPAAVSFNSKPNNMSDGPVFTVGLRVHFTDWIRGGFYDCVVQAENDEADTPSASNQIFRRSFPKDPLSFTCMVKGFRPLGVSIEWHQNLVPLPEGHFSIHNSDPKDPFFISSTLTLPRNMGFSGNSYSCSIALQEFQNQPTQEAKEAEE